MAVYMVKHGIGDTATVMNDISKGWLQAVVNDMCSYTTSAGTKDVEDTDADGNVTTCPLYTSAGFIHHELRSERNCSRCHDGWYFNLSLIHIYFILQGTAERGTTGPL